MELNFCDNCNNLMDIYSDEKNSKLYLGCKCCSNKQDFDEGNKCIYTNESTIELSDITYGIRTAVNNISTHNYVVKTSLDGDFVEGTTALPPVQNGANPNLL